MDADAEGAFWSVGGTPFVFISALEAKMYIDKSVDSEQLQLLGSVIFLIVAASVGISNGAGLDFFWVACCAYLVFWRRSPVGSDDEKHPDLPCSLKEFTRIGGPVSVCWGLVVLVAFFSASAFVVMYCFVEDNPIVVFSGLGLVCAGGAMVVRCCCRTGPRGQQQRAAQVRAGGTAPAHRAS